MKFIRENNFSNKILIIDGQGGCGKTLFSQICSSFKKCEIFNYAFEIEFITKLNKFNKIEDNAAAALIKMFLDHKIYQSMMGRETNFRYNDLSSVFNHPYPFEYFKRIFKSGDRDIPNRIKKNNPILNLTTHDLFAYSEILFEILENRLIFFEIVRHPLYMVIQQHINEKELFNNPRDIQLKFKHRGQEIPYFAHDFSDEYLDLNPIDRAVYLIKKFTEKNDQVREIIHEKKDNLLTIPFERFVLSPDNYLKKMVNLLDTEFGSKTTKILKKNNIPRKNIEDGISKKIYKRYGWEPSIKNTSFSNEKQKRMNYLKLNGAKNKSIEVMLKLSEDYEKKYQWF